MRILNRRTSITTSLRSRTAFGRAIRWSVVACLVFFGAGHAGGCYHADREYTGGDGDGDIDADADGDEDPFTDYGCWDGATYDDMCDAMVCETLYESYQDLLGECLGGDDLSCLMLDVCFMPYVTCMIDACPNESDLDYEAIMECAEVYLECTQGFT